MSQTTQLTLSPALPARPVMLHSRVSALPASEEQWARLGPHARMIHAAADPPRALAELSVLVDLPVGVVTWRVRELAMAGMVGVEPTVVPGTAAARRVLSCFDELTVQEELAPGASSARVGVTGPGAVAFVAALEGPTQVLSPKVSGPAHPQEEFVWFTRLGAGGDGLYVFADASAHTRVGGTWWDQLVREALGVVVTIDAGHVEHALPAVRDCSKRRIPCVLAVGECDVATLATVDEWALPQVRAEEPIPVVGLDASDRSSCAHTLEALASVAILAQEFHNGDAEVAAAHEGGQ